MAILAALISGVVPLARLREHFQDTPPALIARDLQARFGNHGHYGKMLQYAGLAPSVNGLNKYHGYASNQINVAYCISD